MENPYTPPASLTPTLLGRCEWCRDEVWTDYDYLESSGYLWHSDCGADNLMFLEDAIRHNYRGDVD